MDLPDAIEAIKFRMKQQGLTADDLVPAIGRKNRVYEVLARRRPLIPPNYLSSCQASSSSACAN